MPAARPDLLICPGCRGSLRREEVSVGEFWACRTCATRCADLRHLRSVGEAWTIDGMWQVACSGAAASGQPCPLCRQRMVAMTVSGIPAEVCRPCRLVVLADAALGRLCAAAAPPPPPALPLPSTAALPGSSLSADELVRARLAEALARREEEGEAIGGGPEERWKWVAGFLGFPVKMGRMSVARFPLVTVVLLAVSVLATALALAGDLDQAIQAWGFIPAQAWRAGGLTLITGFFLHGGIIHLIGNGWFLFLTGENVEDRYGRGRMLALVALAALAGAAAHTAWEPRSDIPCVGASGGIAGVMACFALTFRRAQIGQAWFFGRIWLRMPAWGWFSVWVVGQLLLAWMQVLGFTHVSAAAHLGGALAGAGCWRWWSATVAQGVQVRGQ
jgi:membrane associated rhomboid family serine protease/Zn-finger nucleic acid-binding protein